MRVEDLGLVFFSASSVCIESRINTRLFLTYIKKVEMEFDKLQTLSDVRVFDIAVHGCFLRS